MDVNGLAPRLLAEQAKTLGAALIHYSTDYVFDGKKCSPYVKTDRPNPINVYGRSKLEGERSIFQVNGSYLILRSSWVYSLRRESFVIKVLRWSRQQKTLRIVSDQIGSPTWARMLAEISTFALSIGREDLVSWIENHKGIYHLAGNGTASRLQWAQAIMRYDPHKIEQIVQKVQAAQNQEFHTPAQRPLYSALDCKHFYATFGLSMPEWKKPSI